MATIENRSGTYRVRIRRQGAPTLSRTFTDPVSAQTWADETERAIQTGTLAQHQHRQTTLAQLLHAYSIKCTPKKKGARQEQRRIEALKRDRLAAYLVQNVQRGLFRDFRDRRAAKVSPSSVNREIALWSVVLGWARIELDVPLPADLLDGLKLQENAARERRLQPGEYESLLARPTGCAPTSCWRLNPAYGAANLRRWSGTGST